MAAVPPAPFSKRCGLGSCSLRVGTQVASRSVWGHCPLPARPPPPSLSSPSLLLAPSSGPALSCRPPSVAYFPVNTSACVETCSREYKILHEGLILISGEVWAVSSGACRRHTHSGPQLACHLLPSGGGQTWGRGLPLPGSLRCAGPDFHGRQQGN